MIPLTRTRILALVLLRTIIGWHFLYEGYFKLIVPGWSRGGAPFGAWTASGYLRMSTGPLGGFFHGIAASPLSGSAVDWLVPLGLVSVGLSLMLGWYTQLGAWGAACFLTLFYIAYIPVEGVPAPNAEGTYLIVNKTLVELAAVGVLLVFRTGWMAGLDLLRAKTITPVEVER